MNPRELMFRRFSELRKGDRHAVLAHLSADERQRLQRQLQQSARRSRQRLALSPTLAREITQSLARSDFLTAATRAQVEDLFAARAETPP